jgi:type II secretory pathway pseudopilin PulG
MRTLPLRRSVPAALPRRGVSLVEALVALAIMSFGMLALVGVQATLRHNSDAARERTEAMRLAAQDSESLRAFGSLDQALVASVVPWDQLDVRAGVPVSLPVTTGLTTSYTLDRQRSIVYDRVAGSNRFDGVQLKVFEVRVSWADRIGNNYAAVLDSAVVAADPALSARLVMPVPTRHASIPTSARDLGNGSSALKPFNQGTVAYVLDNATGYVTSLCTGVVASQSAITLSDVSGSGCATVVGRLLTGTVRYHFFSPVDATASENPLGPTVLPLDQAAPLGFATSGPGIPVNHASPPVCYARSTSCPARASPMAAPATGRSGPPAAATGCAATPPLRPPGPPTSITPRSIAR